MSIAAGFRYLHVGKIDSDGYLVSGATAPTAGGSPVPLMRLEGAQTAPISVPDDEVLTVLGDDAPLVTFDFEAQSLPNGVVEMAVRNPDFEALAQGTKVNDMGIFKSGGLQATGAQKADLVFLMQRRAKTWTPGDRGSSAWEILVALGARARPQGSQPQQRAHTPYRYFITTSKVARKPWGEVFTEADDGMTAAPLLVLDGDYPCMLEVGKGDNTETDYLLTTLPVTGDASGILVYVNGVKSVHTTAWTYSAGTVTFQSGHIPPLNAHIIFVIQTTESELEL